MNDFISTRDLAESIVRTIVTQLNDGFEEEWEHELDYRQAVLDVVDILDDHVTGIQAPEI